MNYVQEIQAKLGSDNAFRSKNSSVESTHNGKQFADYISNEINKFRKDVHYFNEEHLRDPTTNIFSVPNVSRTMGPQMTFQYNTQAT